MLIMGGFFLNGFAFGILLVPPKKVEQMKSSSDVRTQNDMGSVKLYSMEKMNDPTIVSNELNVYETFLAKLKTMFDASVFRSCILTLCCVQWMFFTAGYLVVHTFLPVISSFYGIEERTVSLLLSAAGASDFVGRLVYGAAANTKKIQSVYLVCICGILSGVAYINFTWIRQVPLMFIFIVILGISEGQFIGIIMYNFIESTSFWVVLLSVECVVTIG